MVRPAIAPTCIPLFLRSLPALVVERLVGKDRMTSEEVGSPVVPEPGPVKKIPDDERMCVLMDGNKPPLLDAAIFVISASLSELVICVCDRTLRRNSSKWSAALMANTIPRSQWDTGRV